MSSSQTYPKHFCINVVFAWRLAAVEGVVAAKVVDFVELAAFGFACQLSFLLGFRLSPDAARFAWQRPHIKGRLLVHLCFARNSWEQLASMSGRRLLELAKFLQVYTHDASCLHGLGSALMFQAVDVAHEQAISLLPLSRSRDRSQVAPRKRRRLQ